jgi:Domain of unknown function (DUF4760)
MAEKQDVILQSIERIEALVSSSSVAVNTSKGFLELYGPGLVTALAIIFANAVSIWFAVRNTRQQMKQSDDAHIVSLKHEIQMSGFRLIVEFDEKTGPLQNSFKDLGNDGRMEKCDDLLTSDDPDIINLRKLMNIYEALAIGVKRGLIDEELLREHWRTTYVRTLLRSEALIDRMKEKHNFPNMYKNFIELGSKWTTEVDRELAAQHYPNLIKEVEKQSDI